MQRKINLLLLILISASTSLLANHGKTFEIEEKPFCQEMQMPDQEAITKKQEEQIKKIKAFVDEPPAVQGIEEAKQYRAFYYDPIFRVKEDI